MQKLGLGLNGRGRMLQRLNGFKSAEPWNPWQKRAHRPCLTLYLKFRQPSRMRSANDMGASSGSRRTRRNSRGGANRSAGKGASENSMTSSRSYDVLVRIFPAASFKYHNEEPTVLNTESSCEHK